MAHDTTEPQRMVDALCESEARFRVMADWAPVMIWMSDSEKRCVFFNRRWLDFTGQTMEAELGEGWVEGVHAEDRACCIKEYEKAFDARRSFVLQYRLRRYDGEYRWVEDFGSPLYQPTGTFCGYIGSCIDVTERIVAERAIHESEGKFRALFDSNALPIAYWHRDALVDANDAFLQLIACERRELQHGTAASHPLVRDSRHALRAGGPRFARWERDYRMQDGREVSALVAASLLAEDDDRGMIFVVDLTERKKTEQTLRELSARLFHAQEEERTTIARELHDDIGQRLALLCIGLDELSRRMDLKSDEVSHLLQDLQRRTKELATDVQHISHELYPPKLEHLGLLPALKALCRELSAHAKLRIDVVATGCSPALPRDTALALYRVVQEALQNLVKHSRATHARIEVQEHGEDLDLVVCDSGVGFDMNSVGSTAGIGLVGMQERVRLLRGTLEIDSHPGHGTCIKIRIPLDGSQRKKGEAV